MIMRRIRTARGTGAPGEAAEQTDERTAGVAGGGKLIAHVSDAHFGAHDSTIAAALVTELNALAPTLIAFSGDFTQRGRVSQFQAARLWLEQLQSPWLAVPGNHDIPFFDFATRFMWPRDRYQFHITADLEPCFVDDELAVCGIDTTNTRTVKSGRVTHAQAARAALRFSAHPQKWRVLVAHHPFVVPEGREIDRVEGADAALPILQAAGVDVILTGHLHIASVAGRNEAHTMLSVQAGTCISTRLRGEPNGYNHLRFDDDVLTVVQRVWDGGRFVDGDSKSYQRRGAVGEPGRFIKIGELSGASVAAITRT